MSEQHLARPFQRYIVCWYRKDYTMCTAAKTYEIGQNRLKVAE